MNEHESGQTMPDPKKCPQCGAALPTGALNGLCPACLLKQGAASETATQPESAPFQPPTVAEVVAMFPQLEVLSFIGKGGMGAVYKARQPALDRLVALKILPPQVAAGKEFAERFNREARALAKLNHPNIVTVHEFGQVNGLPYFLMEFVDGLNLRQLEHAGKLTPREALQIIPQICEALQFAHDEGIVHRDIKPENILLDKKGRVKIADFGIAKIMGGEEPDVAITETTNAIGTPHYMAPEQMEKPKTVDHRADIFSLGVVFYEMLTGELPLGKFAPPSHKVVVDVRLDDVVLRALEKEPERRYQQISQVKTAVDTIASTTPPPPPPGGEALAADILARGYELNIGSCLSRGWALVRRDFWPIVGVNALITVLWAIANSSGALISSHDGHTTEAGSLVGLLVNGPLIGGLYLFFLKRIRLQPTTVETAFSGFSQRLLHLFLASIVSFLLVGVGIFCCLLPGIYLAIAWIFTLPLVIDKGLDFWAAMELSRRIVTRHWWKFLGFAILLFLLKFTGIIFCIVGFFITAPIATAALMYAYEDIFGTAGRSANQNPPPAGFGPSGTEIRPGMAAPPRSGGNGWKIAAAIAVTVMLLVVVVPFLLLEAWFSHKKSRAAHEEAIAQAIAAKSGHLLGVEPNVVRVLNGAPFTARLPGGGSVELLAVQIHPASSEPWWQPDGSPSRYGADISVEDENKNIGGGVLAIARVTWSNAPADNSFPDGLHYALKDGHRIPLDEFCILPFEQPVSPTQSATLRLKVGVGEWQTLVTKRPRTFGNWSASEADKLWKFSETAVGTLKINVDHLPTTPDAQYLFVAIDTEGNEHTPSIVRTEHATTESYSKYEVTFDRVGSNAPLLFKNFREIRLKSRLYQQVEFRNVSLQPGLKTAVEVKDFGEADGAVWRASNGAEATPDFYVGHGWFPKGDSIEITSVERSADTMAVKGHYHLVSADEASLTLNITSTNDSSPPGYPAQPEDPTQSLRISKGQGDFELSRSNLVPGLPHVSMYANGHSFAGVYFGTKDEALAESNLDLGNPKASAEDPGQTVAGLPPVVVETFPASGANEVEPGVTEIRVRFSKEMTDGSWSWATAWQDSTPEMIGDPKYEADHRTCVIKARLEPGRTYAFWLNSDKFKNFTDLARRPAVPYLLIFSTKPK